MKMSTLWRGAAALWHRSRSAVPTLVTAAVTAFALLAAGAAHAAVTVIPYTGNKNCPAGTNQIKFDPVVGGTQTVGGVSITVTLDPQPLGPGFDWTISGGTINDVFVKGGPNGLQYHYDPAATSGQDLHAPINPTTKKYYGLSHISFCYEPGVVSVDVTKSCTSQVIVNDEVRATNKVVIINNGDFTLTDVSLEEVTAGFTSCTLTSVNGGATSTALVPGAKTAVPGIASLAVGAEVVATVECSGGAPDVQNTIKAYGTANGITADASSTSDPENTCPLPAPKLYVDKDCPADTDVRLVSSPSGLVVQVCPTITVTNTGTETVLGVSVSDDKIPGFPKVLGDIAPLANKSVRACYTPTTAAEMPGDDGGQSYYDASTATFTNTATATGKGKVTGKTASGSGTASGKECKLCPCEGPDCQ